MHSQGLVLVRKTSANSTSGRLRRQCFFTSKFPPTAHDDRVRLRESDLQSLVKIVLEKILPWALPGDDLSRARGLEKILISAIDLDSHMNEQWAIYLAISNPSGNGQPRYGFEFDGTMAVQ